MNTLVANGSASHPRSDTAFGAASPAPAARPPGFSLLLCGLVMALALLSYFVQVLNEHVQRAQQLRQTHHRSAAAIDSAGLAPAPEVVRQGLVQTAGR